MISVLRRVDSVENEQREAKEFMDLISRWKEGYRIATCSYVALRISTGPRLLLGRVFFSIGHAGRELKVESEHLTAGREAVALGAGDIDKIVARAIDGKMSVGQAEVALFNERGGSLSMWFAPVYHPLVKAGPRLPTLIMRGATKHEVMSSIPIDEQKLDWELKAGEIPYDSLQELLVELELPPLWQMGDSTAIELIANPPCNIRPDSYLVNGTGMVRCGLTKGLDRSKLAIGIKVVDRNSLRRFQMEGSELQWDDEDESSVCTLNFPAGEAPLYQAFLNYDGLALEQRWVLDPQKHLNFRQALFEQIDPDLEYLKQALAGQGRHKSEDFERAVTLLLALLGFSTAHFGQISVLREAPDSIALTPAGNIGIVECTIGMLNENNKLAKLSRRTTLFKERLAASGYQHATVQPVIITALPKREIEAELNEAQRNGIAVVCKEELDSLLNQAKFTPNPEALFFQAVQSVSKAQTQTS